MHKYLKILGLNPNRNYSPTELKEAWRKKCLEVHPDKGGTEEAFLAVTHAFNYLTDPSYRQKHDEDTKSNLNVRFQVPITFEEGFFGTVLKVNYNKTYLDEGGRLTTPEIQEIISLDAVIPPGTCTTTEIVCRERGLEDKKGNKGDAYLYIMPQSHPKFVVRGMDVFSQEQIPLWKLLKGGEAEVETMYGIKTLKIKPGTSPDSHLGLIGNGVLKSGNHYVQVKPLYPTQSDLKNSREWRGLDKKWGEYESDNIRGKVR